MKKNRLNGKQTWHSFVQPTRLAAALFLLTGAAQADVPRVATDIAPVHGLVAQVMAGVGTPELIVSHGASPHSHQLRPSQAAALQDADLVFWTGADLTPWMADALETLAGDASVIGLLADPGTVRLAFREGALFEGHDHDDAEHEKHDDDHDHDHDEGAKHDHDQDEKAEHDNHAHDDHDHDDHAHKKDEHGEEDHAHEDHSDEDHGHDHGEYDPHAWLSLTNAAHWAGLVAEELARLDPDNAATYRENAAAIGAEFAELRDEIETLLAPVRDGRFIVFHDAYQYFENDFGLSAVGAISLGDATDPSPARIAEIRARVSEERVDCVMAEPQFNPGLVAIVAEGTSAKTGIMDPLGSEIETGAAFYPALMRSLAQSLVECL